MGPGQRRSNIPSALVRGGVKGVIGVAGMDTLWLFVVVGLEVSDIARDAAVTGGNFLLLQIGDINLYILIDTTFRTP